MKLVKAIPPVLLLCLTLSILSCMPFAKNKYKVYEDSVFQTSAGKFSVGLAPDSKLVQEGKKQIEIFGAPYNFNTQYYTSKETFLSGEITNLEIRSLETGDTVYKEALIIDIYRTSKKWSHHASKQKTTLGFGGDVRLNIPHHDYRVLFDFKIYKEEGVGFDEGSVDIVLKRDYYEGYIRKGGSIL